MRRFVLAASIAALFCLLGCQPSADGTSADADGTGADADGTGADGIDIGSPQAAEVESQVSLAFVTNQIADFWYIAQAGCSDAAKDFGVQVEVRMPADATAVEQKRIVEDLVTGGIQGLAISPLDADNQQDWIDEIAAQIPLITHDSDAPGSNRLVYIGMDNHLAGRMCGELVRQALPDGGEVMIFIGRLEQDNAKLRRQGVIDALLGRDRTAAYYEDRVDAWDSVEEEITGDGFTILGTLTDTGRQEIAQRKAEDAITSYPEMDAMVGLFAYNPPACYQALKKAGKLGAIQLIGFDESDLTLQAIREGNCLGTIVQDPYEYGYQSVEILKSIIDGDDSLIPESKFIDIPPRAITKDIVDDFSADLEAKKSG
jgi:ribose transport system substrate-binding protein